MIPQLSDPRWTDAQRQFVAALEAAGATKAEHAVPIDRATPLAARELQALVDSGFVREASSNGYYVYPRNAVQLTPLSRDAAKISGAISRAMTDEVRFPTGKRAIKQIIFWLIMILIPIVILELMGNSAR